MTVTTNSLVTGVPRIVTNTAFTMVVTGSVSNPTKATSPTFDLADYSIVGNEMKVRWSYRQPNTTGAAAGSGDYLFSLPSGFTADSRFVKINTDPDSATTIGHGEFNTPAGLTIPVKFYLYTSTKIAAKYLSAGAYTGAIDNTTGFAGGTWAMVLNAIFPITT